MDVCMKINVTSSAYRFSVDTFNVQIQMLINTILEKCNRFF